MPGDRSKTIHLAAKVSERGGVSAACFAAPRAINLTRASWTIRPDAVTCPRCLRQMKADDAGQQQGGGDAG